MSRVASAKSRPAPASHSAQHTPHAESPREGAGGRVSPSPAMPPSTQPGPDARRSAAPRPFFTKPYSYTRPFPALPEQWRSEAAQAKPLNEYLTHDGFFGTFATQRGLTVDQLYDGPPSEEITARRKRLEEMAVERADLLAILARPAAIQSLLSLLQKGMMSDNQLRLAAGALLRAADRAAGPTAPRRASAPPTPRPADPPTSSPCATASCTAPRCATSPRATGQPALGLAGADAHPDPRPPQQPTARASRTPRAPSTMPNARAGSPLPAASSRILARIGPAPTSPPPSPAQRTLRNPP